MNAEPLTVGELASMQTLRSEVIAGASGLDRRVVWAHSCELEDPWLWLGPDELLLTIGFAVPRTTAEQVRFVQELDAAGIAGAMIGERHVELELSDEMLREADRLGFPVMRTQHQVPWSAVSRHVAAASSVNQTSQVLLLAKLYELTATSSGPSALANNIARLLRIEFRVVEDDSGLSVMASELPRDEATVDARVRTHRLQSRHPATLEVTETTGFELGAMVLVHLKRILEVEADRVLYRIAARAEEWQQMLDELLIEGDGRWVGKQLNLEPERVGCQIIAFPTSELERISKGAVVRDLTAVVGCNRESGLMLVPTSEAPHARELCEDLGVSAGVSVRFDQWREVRGAVSEAVSALHDAVANGVGWSEFEGTRIAVLARSEREARLIIKDVFGPLADDTDKMKALRETLFVYLRNERSWAESAAELGIHRQTLSYRLRRIETLTDRAIAKTEDLAALWIAMQAWNKFGSQS